MRDIPLSELPPPVLPPPPPSPPVETENTIGVGNRNWRAPTAPLALVTVLVGATMVGFVFGLVVLATGGKTEDPPSWFTVLSTVAQDGMFIAIPAYFAHLAGRLRVTDFGFRKTRFWPAVGWVAVAWLATVIALAIFSTLIGYQGNDKLPQDLGAGDSVFQTVVVGLLVAVLAPIAEEVFFRGYYFPALSNRLGVAAGIVLTGITFGAIHIFNYIDQPIEAAIVALPYLMILGGGLCFIYWKTRSLLPCIALHSINNALAFGVSMDWNAWQILLTAVGALAICAIFAVPLVRQGRSETLETVGAD